jgi:hypothetical protein
VKCERELQGMDEWMDGCIYFVSLE